MNAALTPLDSILVTVVLATLAVGLPVVLVMSIRFLWDRSVNIGQSKEMDKLIWQLHRIASAQEHQLNLSFPAVQPGTEEARDLAFLQPLAQPTAARSGAAPSARATAAATRTVEVEPAGATQATVRASAPEATPVPARQQASAPAAVPAQTPAETQRHGVNSMFGL